MLCFLLSGFLLYLCFRYDSYFEFLSLSFFLLICTGDAYTHAVSLALEKALKGMLGCNRFCSNLYVVCNLVFLEFVLCIADPAGIDCMFLLWVELLQLKGNAGSKQQHVRGCSLVWARKFYGYRSSEELFVKIDLYPNIILSLLEFSYIHI